MGLELQEIYVTVKNDNNPLPYPFIKWEQGRLSGENIKEITRFYVLNDNIYYIYDLSDILSNIDDVELSDNN